MTDYLCPSCGEQGVPPVHRHSKMLIIGEYPGDFEMKKHRPFSGPAGGVFRRELARVGLDMVQFSMTNVWFHPPNKKENCLIAGRDVALEMAKGMKAILLVGSDAVEEFTNGYKVSDISGLPLDTSDHKFSCKNVMAIINPAIVFRPGKGIGEIRFGVEHFYKMITERGVIEE